MSIKQFNVTMNCMLIIVIGMRLLGTLVRGPWIPTTLRDRLEDLYKNWDELTRSHISAILRSIVINLYLLNTGFLFLFILQLIFCIVILCEYLNISLFNFVNCHIAIYCSPIYSLFLHLSNPSGSHNFRWALRAPPSAS